MLYIPKSRAGKSAMMTKLMTRFESMESWMCTPLFDVLSGTKRKVSMPSKTLPKAWNLPPGSKFGFILSR